MVQRCDDGPKLASALRLLRERDALTTRVRILEGALACIEHETERALADTSLAWIVTRRVAAVARQAVHRPAVTRGGPRMGQGLARCTLGDEEAAPPSGVVARTAASCAAQDRAS